jgi:ATP-dependent exoDNAse (exonuclease V) alpha subunit
VCCLLDAFILWCTGRASQRLQELLSGEHAEEVSASTIHRLLGYRNGAVVKRLAVAAAGEAAGSNTALDRDSDAADLDLGSKCEHNVDNPLPAGNYLVDEVSMMDMGLAAALFNALR